MPFLFCVLVGSFHWAFRALSLSLSLSLLNGANEGLERVEAADMETSSPGYMRRCQRGLVRIHHALSVLQYSFKTPLFLLSVFFSLLGRTTLVEECRCCTTPPLDVQPARLPPFFPPPHDKRFDHLWRGIYLYIYPSLYTLFFFPRCVGVKTAGNDRLFYGRADL